jgi:hypothetical protein
MAIRMSAPRSSGMRVRERRQVVSRITQALIFLRGEAMAAALDEVAAAIGDAELSIGSARQKARPPLPREIEGGAASDCTGTREARPVAAGTNRRGST